MSYEPESYEYGPTRAAERTNLPGIFLIVVGALNIFGGLYMIFNGFVVMNAPDQAATMIKGWGFGNEQVGAEQMKGYGVFYIAWGVVALIACFVIIAAGLKMRSLQAYGLAMTGAIAAAIPCVSCLGCCGVGEAIGIWAIVVLLNEEVKAAFR